MTTREGYMVFVGAFNQEAFQLFHAYRLETAPGVILLYGEQGAGKTELLEYLYHRQVAVARLYNGSQFAHRYVDAVQSNTLDLFRREMRSTRLFLLDDIQDLKRKAKSIEELLYTYEYIINSGGKMVLTFSGAWADLGFLGPRLESRLLNGLLVPVKLPRPEEMDKFIQEYARRRYILMEPQVAEELARRVATLAEAKFHIQAFVRYGEEAGSALTGVCFDQYWEKWRKRQEKRPTSANILKAVAELTGAKETDILGSGRKPGLLQARQLAMYMMRSLGQSTYEEIGGYFGRTHGAALHAWQKVDQLKGREPWATMIGAIRERFEHDGA